MELSRLFPLLFLVAVAPSSSTALRILGMYPLPAHSHFVMFQALFEALVERGHEVVLFSPFPSKSPRANWTDVDTSRGRPSYISTFTFDMVNAPSWGIPGMQLYQMIEVISDRGGNSLCRDVFTLPAFEKLMAGGFGHFDVVFTEIFGSDCWAAVPHKLGVPVIAVSSAPDVSWMHDRIGSIDNPSYINNVFTDFFGPMSLWERLTNTVSRIFINYLFKTKMQDASDPLVQEFFGDNVPPLHELVKNTSLVFLNRHVSIHAARPVVPNLVYVGGLHIKEPPGKLGAELRKWMDEAEHGVIFFSLGSLIRASSMPQDMKKALLGAFARLPQRVLWKYEEVGLALPPNVRVAKWLPQMDILTHPKTILFITHGGLMGTLESLHSSVPMLGIPLFADQMTNIGLYMTLGIADKLDANAMTEEDVLVKITNMTTDPSYRKRAREVATLFNDRPRTAKEEVVWWTEYVVRHRGARHLRTVGADLPLHQYLLLDAAALALILALTAFIIVFLAARAVVAYRVSSPPDRDKKAA